MFSTDESSCPQTAGLPPNSNPQSRRPSETMLPPPSASTKGPRSESSTPKAISAPKNLLAATAPYTQASLNSHLSGFAQSIISASSINVKIDNLNEAAIQGEAETRRNQRYPVVYQALIDHSNLRREASHKARVRLSKQFETHTTNQGIIASQLEAQLAQPSAPAKDGKDSSDAISRIKLEISDMRKELRATQTTLEDQKRRLLKPPESEKSNRKAVHYHDLEGYVKKKDFLLLEKKIPASNLYSEKLEGKISDLAVVTGERHRDAQAAQEHNKSRLQNLDMTISKFQDQQTNLGKWLDAQKEDGVMHSTEMKGLHDNLLEIKTTINGNPEHNEPGLVTSMKSNETTLAQTQHAIEQLKEVTQTLEERIRENHQRSSQTLPEDQSVLAGDIQTLRQDLETLAEDQNKEYTLLVEGINNLESGMKQCQGQLFRLNEGAKEKVIEKSPEPLQTNGVVSSDGYDLVKIEKIETDLKALDMQFLVQKRQFDNLTTEHLAQCIIHQTKQLYKEHPGHVQDKLRDLEKRQFWTDSYLTKNLEPRLEQMTAAIGGCVAKDTIHELRVQTQKSFANNVDTKKEISDAVNVVKSSLNKQGDALTKVEHDAAIYLETTTERLNALQEDVENLKRGVDARTAIHLARFSGFPVATALEGRSDTRVEDDVSIAKESQRTISRPTTSSISTNRDDAEEGSGRSAPLSANSSESHDRNALRKRKSFLSVSDSEDNDEKGAARKVPRMGS